MFLYIKALHIIFIVTWFAGLFYIPRLFVYNTEAAEKEGASKEALRQQFSLMIRRLWYGITWPSALLTLVFGGATWWLYGAFPRWLAVKLVFVAGLYAYHLSLHVIVRQQLKGVFRYRSQQLRVWNEVATIFLIAIVMLAVVKEAMSFVWGLAGLVIFIALLMSAIKLYKYVRIKKSR